MNMVSFKDTTTIFEYHERTKHRYDRFAKSPGHMDWTNQPDPFRHYDGKPPVKLPLLDNDPAALYPDLYLLENTQPSSFNLKNIAGFLELSLGLSAWKTIPGSRWPLRINPSSGNLHPTECHLVVPAVKNFFRPGVYHYNPFSHCLEPRAKLSEKIWQDLENHFQTSGFLLGLSSVFWRESWKYGERAFRYCHLDVGHALACVRFSATLFGWKLIFLNALSDEQIETILGFSKTQWPPGEKEHPDLLCYVFPVDKKNVPRYIPDNLLQCFSTIDFFGVPNPLSQEHVNWEIIDHAASQTVKPQTEPVEIKFDKHQPFVDTLTLELPAAPIIRQRRSAQQFDPTASISCEQFFSILDKTLPRNGCAPFDVELTSPVAHLLLFVHHVTGLDPGLYFFIRYSDDIDELKYRCKPEFLWTKINHNVPLFLLEKGNFRKEAARVSCCQDIAGDSCFSVGMIVNFKETVNNAAYTYRQLFWETGMIGQVLYLGAEAHGIRGTGIGCFFDDPVHHLLGFKDNRYQSLYHFTIGKPIIDHRLKTLPPYYHLNRKKE
jgi:SagB-type dehydrogenase family enzyme